MKSNVRIGVSAKFHDRSPSMFGERQSHIQYLETTVASWISRNKALPFMIPSESTEGDIGYKSLDPHGFARELDALILQGGVDVHPSLYGGSVAVDDFATDIVRDRYELALIKAFLDEGKPVLGICRGLQLLNVHFGGTLYADLETAGFSKHLDHQAGLQFAHEIKLVEGGVFADLYGPSSKKVISVHHQGIHLLGEGLQAEAYSVPDGVIEAFSCIDLNRFVIGIQWHPELHPVGDASFLDADKLLKFFIHTAVNRKYYGTFQAAKKRTVEFSKSAQLTIGAELELQIVHPESFDLCPSAAQMIAQMEEHTKKIKSEIFQSMIEIETGICENANEIEKDLLESKKVLLETADQFNVLIGSAGTHPFAKYSERRLTPHQRYFDLMDSKQWIARRISIFGMHAHIGVSSPEQGIELYRFYMSMAPIFLALSASSPFFQGEVTGLMSVRSTFFESTPTGGHPPVLKNWFEFEGLMTKLLRSQSISSHKDLWWDIRPSPNYGTIELRMCDSMPTMQENIALLALIHACGYAFLNWKGYGQWPNLSEWSYRENKWRALRYGLEYDFILTEDGRSLPMRDYVLNLLEDMAQVIQFLQYEEKMQFLKDKMLVSTPAARDFDMWNAGKTYEDIVKNYCEQFRK